MHRCAWETLAESLAYLEMQYVHWVLRTPTGDSSWSDAFREFLPSRSADGETSRSRLRYLYREKGYLWGLSNPLAPKKAPTLEELHFPSSWTSDAQLLQRDYCGTVGVDLGFVASLISDTVYADVENGRLRTPFSAEEKREIASMLIDAHGLEAFLHTKHVGKKRFSLEGEESLIPALLFLMRAAERAGVSTCVMGMSHRGRINVLTHLLGCSLEEIFLEFDEDEMPPHPQGRGDMRYHRGHKKEGEFNIILLPNASHLESIDPIVAGYAAALQQQQARGKVLPLLIHGDAAVAAQGVVYELFQMAHLPGYQTGGIVHLVLNNRVGFTTSEQEGRSTPFATDIAHTFGVPVFHVNVEDVEAVVRCVVYAFELRTRFQTDVIVELNGYRKYGHHEADDPTYTNPLLYQQIERRASVPELYTASLEKEGVIAREWALQKAQEARARAQRAYQRVESGAEIAPKKSILEALVERAQFSTAFFLEAAVQLTSAPSTDFNLHPKLRRLLQERQKMVCEQNSVDWAMAELLAYAALLSQGTSVRLSGQDAQRGTFNHRHAVWKDQTTGESYSPLAAFCAGKARFVCLNSPLSEEGVLGFEYGFSLGATNALTLWEAQFGDFANAAQVLIDQYLSSGEQKWGQFSPLTLLLPHGMEGQGSEHSSARLERFLALAGDQNMRIVQPTTPAQLFHLLIEQTTLSLPRPLVVFTPKGLLRHPLCKSALSELEAGGFRSFLYRAEELACAEKVIFCSGKLFYELQEEREQRGAQGTAIVRMEQLYPFDLEQWNSILESAPKAALFWVQEEPENMGAWPYLVLLWQRLFPKGIPVEVICRPVSSAPATGYHAQHALEQQEILERVFRR